MFVLQLKKTLSPGGTTRDSGTFVKNIPEKLCIFISTNFFSWSQKSFILNKIFWFGDDTNFGPEESGLVSAS